jgi:hypothetical protein
MVGGGAGAAPSTITTGTGVTTALGVNTGTAGAFVVNGGALGTPSSGTVTNLTGTASININGTVGATTANTGAFTTLTATSIKFGSGTVLSSYEEGTWTPVATAQIGTLTAYTSSGTYTKVGRLVYLSGKVSITTAGTASGVMFLAGYPFTNGSTTLSQLGSANEIDLTATVYQVRILANVTTGFIQSLTGGGIVWTATGNYNFSLVYYAT